MLLEIGKRDELLLSLVTVAGGKVMNFMTGRQRVVILRGVTTSTGQSEARS